MASPSDALQRDSKPIPATKTRRSRKAPSVKSAVIAKRAQGQNITSIANDLGITRNTTRTIIEESDIDRHLAAGEITAFGMVHKSLDVLNSRLDKQSESAATYLLSNTLFSERYSKKAAPPADVVVNLAIQNLIQPASQPAIDTQATAEQQTSQVIDTHSDNK